MLYEVITDDFGIHVIMQIPEQVQFVHIRLVADGDKLGESEIPVCGKIKDRGAKRASYNFV